MPNFVTRENKEMTLGAVEKLFRKRRAGITAEMCKNWMQMKKKVILNSTVIKRIFNFLMCKCELII